MSIDAVFLKSIPYFSVMNPAELEAIKPLFAEKTVQRGEVILMEGEASDTLFFVAAGAVKIFKTSAQGKDQILSIARPGEALNDIPIFDGGTNPVNAQAMGPVTLYSLKKDRLQNILRQYPVVALNTNKVLAQRMRLLVSLVEDLSFRHVLGRVTKILLTHAGDGAGHRPSDPAGNGRDGRHRPGSGGAFPEIAGRTGFDPAGTPPYRHHG